MTYTTWKTKFPDRIQSSGFLPATPRIELVVRDVLRAWSFPQPTISDLASNHPDLEVRFGAALCLKGDNLVNALQDVAIQTTDERVGRRVLKNYLRDATVLDEIGEKAALPVIRAIADEKAAKIRRGRNY